MEGGGVSGVRDCFCCRHGRWPIIVFLFVFGPVGRVAGRQLEIFGRLTRLGENLG
jgi:hypothetical protein